MQQYVVSLCETSTKCVDVRLRVASEFDFEIYFFFDT
jgi:hypothetical protein